MNIANPRAGRRKGDGGLLWPLEDCLTCISMIEGMVYRTGFISTFLLGYGARLIKDPRPLFSIDLNALQPVNSGGSGGKQATTRGFD